MRKETIQFYIPVLLALAVAAALVYYWLQANRRESPEVPAVVPAPTAPPAIAPGGPLHPFPRIDSPKGPGGELVPLPPLDRSDAYLKLALTDLLGSDVVAKMLAETDLITRIVATVDNLPRDHVAERIRPISGLTQAFDAVAAGDNEFTISPESYRRYDLLVDLVSRTDVNEVAAIYSRFYPLFQKAYVDLGYPDAHFNDRLVEVIDHLLQTPEVEEPVRLIRPHVLYEYADGDLEKLSSGQKLLIRMGGGHATRIKAKMRELRAMIANPDAPG